MKKALFILSFLGTFCISWAQDVTGDWYGYLKDFQLRIVFHVTESENGLSSTLDSPDQGAKGIPTTATLFENSVLTITASNLGAVFKGELVDETLQGTFSQGGMEIPVTLTRNAMEKPVVKRPQEPKEPYPYYTEEVVFRNEKADLSLAGTLTLPKKEGNFPVVILISGSGPQDRNEELLGHKPFLVLADHLTRKGMATLRYDDRGFGQSTGNFASATSADFATDVASAMAYLKTRSEIDASKIGLLGHSEGGLIAPMVAAKSEDVNFIVLLAGPGLRGDKILLLQQGLIAKASGTPEERIRLSQNLNAEVFKIVSKSIDLETLKFELTDYLKKALNNEAKALVPEGMAVENFISTQVNAIATPWMLFFIKHDPAPILEKVTCPVLAINGEKDLQVPPKQNLAAIETALKKGGNRNATYVELAGLNHLFQECETGAPSEYGQIEQTFSPTALKSVSDWIVDLIE